MKVIDCFPFHNEFKLLEIRLNELYDIVDYFIIVEANTTHSGIPKLFYLKNVLEKSNIFDRFKNKIKLYSIDMSNIIDENYKTLVYDLFKDVDQSGSRWYKENYQSCCSINVAKEYCNNDKDIIIYGDADEIARKQDLQYIIENNIVNNNIINLNMKYYYGQLNNFVHYNWYPAIITDYKMLKQTKDLRVFRSWANLRNTPKKLINCGWHFTSIGGPKKFVKKVRSNADYKLLENVTDEQLMSRIKNGEWYFGDKVNYTIHKIDETFPEYVLKNQDKFKNYINYSLD